MSEPAPNLLNDALRRSLWYLEAVDVSRTQGMTDHEMLKLETPWGDEDEDPPHRRDEDDDEDNPGQDDDDEDDDEPLRVKKRAARGRLFL